MLQAGLMNSYSSERFHVKTDETESYEQLKKQHKMNNKNTVDSIVNDDNMGQESVNIPTIPREAPAEEPAESESLGNRIQLLKSQMIALKESSIAFRENMEAVLSTIQGISQSTNYNAEWTLRSSGNQIFPQFGSSSGKQLLTGIASRIERTNMEIANLGILDENIIPYSCPVTPSDRQTSETSENFEVRSHRNEFERIKSHEESSENLVSKRQLKVNTDTIRPNSESFAHNNKDNMEQDITEDERTNSLPLTQAKSTSCKRVLLAHGSKDGIDAGNGLRASETSIDSGYHGSNNVPPHGRVYSPASPLTKIYDEVESNASNENTRPQIPSYLPLSKPHGDYNEPQALENTSNISQNNKNVDGESPPQLPPKKSHIKTTIALPETGMKPRVPRSSKKIKMGVSAVTSPLPKTRTVFNSDNNKQQNVTNNDNKTKKAAGEQIKTRCRVSMSKDDDEISVLRRRSMRMMTEFKLFDFSDCMASNAKPSELKKPIIIDIDVKKEKAKIISAQAQSSSTKQNKTRKTSVKPRRSESKFSNEPLPSPPLPPPPPAPPVESPKPVRVLEFKDFSSLAKDSKRSVVCKVDSNTPVSSPSFIRKNKINQELSSLHQLSQTSFQNSSALTPSNGSAFTPVSAWSDVSLDDLTAPGIYDESAEQRNIQQTSKIVVPQPIRPVPQQPTNPQNQYMFKRKGSLPLAAISNRSKYKQQQQNLSDHSNLTPQMPLKRVQSMRERRNHGYNGYAAQPRGRLDHLEKDPVTFNRNDNLAKVVSALREAGYGLDGPRESRAKSRQQSDTQDNSQSQRTNDIHRSKSRDQNTARERREEHQIKRSSHEQSDRASRNKSTIDIIRASFRGRRGKSVPSNSTTNACHEFSTGLPRCQEANEQCAIKREDQSAPPSSSRRNSQNKVKQRVDQKPVTPVPSVEKARRKKNALDKSQSKHSGISLYEKLRNVALKQQINISNKKQSHDEANTPKSKHNRQRISSQTSEKSLSSHYSDRSKQTDYPTGSLASSTSMTSYASSITNSNRKNKKSTFV